MGKLAPSRQAPVQRIPRPLRINPCDRCGYSKDGGRIADAKYEIQVPGGSVFLCGSHLRKHWVHILERGYDVVDHAEVDSVSTGV